MSGMRKSVNAIPPGIAAAGECVTKSVTVSVIVPCRTSPRQALTKYEKRLKHPMNDDFAVLDSNK
jgi:hypothetical protein